MPAHLARPNRDLFVAEYLRDRNATQAAIRCGYSVRAAPVTGHRLLKDAKIAAEIDAALAAMVGERIMSATETLERFTTIARASLGKFMRGQGADRYLDFSDATEEDLETLAELGIETRTQETEDGRVVEITRTRIKLQPKIEALKAMANHHGLTKPAEVTVTLGFADRLAQAYKRVEEGR